jgi:hypothetical protein
VDGHHADAAELDEVGDAREAAFEHVVDDLPLALCPGRLLLLRHPVHLHPVIDCSHFYHHS